MTVYNNDYVNTTTVMSFDQAYMLITNITSTQLTNLQIISFFD